MAPEALCTPSNQHPADDNDSWQRLIADSITTAEGLAVHLPVDPERIRAVIRRYPMRINPYYLALIRRPQDPIWRQAVPDPAEICDTHFPSDGLGEEPQSPVPNLTHRYPDRVLFSVSSQCAVYCRHCMRKRMVGRPAGVSAATRREGVAYIRHHREVRDVILSGGDPLMLADDVIASLLATLRGIPHVETIRIHSRIPCTLPQRITPSLVGILRRFHPLFLNTHFNHPTELTPAAARACGALADAGIPLGCQTVLLKGVNDHPAVMQSLLRGLLRMRVKPYYLHHPDPVRGTAHFRLPVRKGLALMRGLRGAVSGMAVPQYMIDLPGGGGKVPLLPDYVHSADENRMRVSNYRGEVYEYPG
ncbi:MAG: KamA family radical SAM protein [Desulfobacterales bacterium]